MKGLPEIIIRAAVPDEEWLIKEKINEFQLDPVAFDIQQFLVAEQMGELIAIGRIREHKDCSELCTLGVVAPERLKGNASRLVKHLVEKAKNPRALFLVCIIPEFFRPHGFEIVEHGYPHSMAEKLMRCETDLPVPEKYVVMKKIKP